MNRDRRYNREEHQNNSKSTPFSGCYFHRKQVLVGICALCLNERLLILASKQAGPDNTSFFRRNRDRFRKPSSFTSFPKIFAFGSYFFNNRLEIRNLKSDEFSDHDYASTSQDDSFISIKFEDNGDTSWDKGKSSVSKVSLEHCKVTTWNHSLRKETPKRVIEHYKAETNKESKSVIEHAKPRGSLRWRKRIGHLFRLIKWKRSNKTTACNKVEGVRVRKGWIRALIRMRTKE